ncbi:MAG: hypothetical protein HC917_04135 [Richelia sp. SM2_1_7]|nr:hypothetical protein [Richelia sp. SM2_1_7]
MALPKANRLRSRHDFRAVFREGVRFHGMYMTLRALRPCNQKSPSWDASHTNEQEKHCKQLLQHESAYRLVPK